MTQQVRQRVRLSPSPSSSHAFTLVSKMPRKFKMEYVPTSSLIASSHQVHKPNAKLDKLLTANIARFEQAVPIVIDEHNRIINGHAIKRACDELKLPEVLVVRVTGLSDAEIATLKLSLNQLANMAEWDPAGIKFNLELIFQFTPELASFTGFSLPEIDMHLGLAGGGFQTDEDTPVVIDENARAVSRVGDLFEFAGGHRLLCGDATDPKCYDRLLGKHLAQMAFMDLPYGRSVRAFSTTHKREFVEGSGDKTELELEKWFRTIFSYVGQYSIDGAVEFSCIDFHSMHAMLNAGRSTDRRLLAIVTWDKGAAGMGGLYRQASEFVLVFHKGKTPYINNVQLGKHGRNRDTLWRYPGLAQSGKGRQGALKSHPTVKNLGLVCDAILDVSHRDGIILDPTVGSGTTLVAAARTGRRGFGMDRDPIYVDVAVKRMQAITGQPARHAETGLTFAELTAQRTEPTAAARCE